MNELNWGVSTSLGGELADPGAIAELADLAESAGWDGFFVWDHLWNRTGEPFADPWVTLAAVAVASHRMKIGTLVTPLPRRRPQVVAQHVTTLDRLAAGRFVLGLGLGHDGYGEYSIFGEPLDDARSRAKVLDEGIELLMATLAGRPAPGASHATHLSPSQSPRCPIWVAGKAGVGAGPKRAARHGLEGIALAGTEEWFPAEVSGALNAGGFGPGDVDVILTGGSHVRTRALAEAGATWAVPEITPGTSLAGARERVERGPDR